MNGMCVCYDVYMCMCKAEKKATETMKNDKMKWKFEKKNENGFCFSFVCFQSDTYDRSTKTCWSCSLNLK